MRRFRVLSAFVLEWRWKRRVMINAHSDFIGRVMGDVMGDVGVEFWKRRRGHSSGEMLFSETERTHGILHLLS